MKNILQQSTKWLFIGLTLLVMVSCEEDESDGISVDNIIGTWEVESVAADATINEMDFIDYMTSELELSEVEAQLMYSLFMSEIEDMSGTIDMKEDGTYIAHFEDDSESGTWELNSNTLLLDKDLEDEQSIEVLTLTETTMILRMSDTMEEDMNEDGTLETMVMTMTMTFKKVM